MASTISRPHSARLLSVGKSQRTYFTEVETREELIIRINAAFEVMRGEMLLRTTTGEIRRRCRAWIENRGRQFEQSLN